jgi:predicted SnoaL-like aldol condensation-catalyzing enzyme
MTIASQARPDNRQILMDFIELFYHRRQVRLAFERHVAEDYIQHNPNIGDGREAAIEALEPLFGLPTASFQIHRILVDGDYAAIHLHGRRSPDVLGGAVVDLYRFSGGRIVEHWDVLQPIPEQAANPHAMF